jgi:hypothetical protein
VRQPGRVVPGSHVRSRCIWKWESNSQGTDLENLHIKDSNAYRSIPVLRSLLLYSRSIGGVRFPSWVWRQSRRSEVIVGSEQRAGVREDRNRRCACDGCSPAEVSNSRSYERDGLRSLAHLTTAPVTGVATITHVTRGATTSGGSKAR